LAITFMNTGKSVVMDRRFTGLPIFYLYNVVSFPFVHALSPTLNLWSLGLWLAVFGWLAGSQDNTDFEWHRYLTTSMTWFFLYLFLMLSLEYFPTRYKVHLLVPLALITTLGISRIQRLGLWKVADCYAETRGLLGFLWTAVVSVPTAAFLAPLLASAL